MDMSERIIIELPQNTPLMCDAKRVQELFGIGKSTLDELRKHKGFPVRKIGRSVWYLVPELYAWLRDFPGEAIPTK